MPTLVPNYLTVDPVTGEVGANFPGGVTIPAAPTLFQPSNRKIRWIRDSDGALMAEIFGTENENLDLRAGETDLARLLISGGNFGGVVASVANSAGSFEVIRESLNGNAQQSDFAKINRHAEDSPSGGPGLSGGYNSMDWEFLPLPLQLIPALAAGGAVVQPALPTLVPVVKNGNAAQFAAVFAGWAGAAGGSGSQIIWGGQVTNVGGFWQVVLVFRNVTGVASPANIPFVPLFLVGYRTTL